MMKHYTRSIFVFCFGLFSSIVIAQAPQKFSYQAVIRNASNQLLANQLVGIKISLLQGSSSGTLVYSETHQPTTNSNGAISIEIGGGSILSGSFSSINWAIGPYFIQTDTDVDGGSNYTITSTTQLLSVPYALYAASSASSIPGPQGPAGAQGPTGHKVLLEQLVQQELRVHKEFKELLVHKALLVLQEAIVRPYRFLKRATLYIFKMVDL